MWEVLFSIIVIISIRKHKYSSSECNYLKSGYIATTNEIFLTDDVLHIHLYLQTEKKFPRRYTIVQKKYEKT